LFESESQLGSLVDWEISPSELVADDPFDDVGSVGELLPDALEGDFVFQADFVAVVAVDDDSVPSPPHGVPAVNGGRRAGVH
jgi:hypothetical protein